MKRKLPAILSFPGLALIFLTAIPRKYAEILHYMHDIGENPPIHMLKDTFISIFTSDKESIVDIAGAKLFNR
jgi:hypothetical protein